MNEAMQLMFSYQVNAKQAKGEKIKKQLWDKFRIRAILSNYTVWFEDENGNIMYTFALQEGAN